MKKERWVKKERVFIHKTAVWKIAQGAKGKSRSRPKLGVESSREGTGGKARGDLRRDRPEGMEGARG